MEERHETVIVGGGHAGLAMSRQLSRRGRPHVVLLPGQPYDGRYPEVFSFARSVDAYVARAGLAAPEEAPPQPPPPGATGAPIGTIDLDAASIGTVIWAPGFRRDFGWIHRPVLDERGEPIHRRGVTRCPGLSFLGLAWLHTLKSSALCGVGRDADHLAEHIASRADAPAPGPALRRT